MSEPPEGQDAPRDARDPTTGSEGQWRNVPRPTTEELLTPSAQVVDPPRIPGAVKVIGIIIVLVLLLLSIWLGLSLGQAENVSPSPTPSVEKVTCDLEAPTQVGSLVRGDVKTTSPDERDTVTTTYSDGTDKVVLLLSCPETDLTTYLDDAAIINAAPVEDSNGISCGVTESDKDIKVCARIVDDTAISVAGLTEQDRPTLTSLVDAFYEEMR